MKKALIAVGAVLAMAQVASAQTSAPSSANTPSTNAPAADPHKGLSAQVQTDLQNAGFSDVKVMPESFLINAKDKAGHAVTMVINPDSSLEVTTFAAAPNRQSASAGQTFVNIAQGDKLSSNLVGLNVTNGDNKDIGTIKDVAVGQNGVQAYILSVGGFLGMGEHYVAVSSAKLNVTYNATDKKWHAMMNATSDQLKAAPEFKYTGEWSTNHG